MKPLFKYPATLFILLLVGYTQVFAHAYRVDFTCPPVKKGNEQNHVQSPVATTTGIESIYFEEEENKRDDSAAIDFICTDLSVFYFQGLTTDFSSREHFSTPDFFKSPLFRVLRL